MPPQARNESPLDGILRGFTELEVNYLVIFKETDESLLSGIRFLNKQLHGLDYRRGRLKYFECDD